MRKCLKSRTGAAGAVRCRGAEPLLARLGPGCSPPLLRAVPGAWGVSGGVWGVPLLAGALGGDWKVGVRGRLVAPFWGGFEAGGR